MKKMIVILGVMGVFLVSGFSVYSYMSKKDQYIGQTVVPEERNDLPLYEGLTFSDHDYVIKGNHWHAIYTFYKEKLPENGWKLVHTQASLEGNGGFRWTGKKMIKTSPSVADGTLLKMKQKLFLT
ncbi:hypothetical protein KUV80_14095 [Fictibacillus nanhaiensis]|uniref:hypothetical protein n=1 Tax=Fictibacillus nanhaiensis TaxID=742169 RepID=UPI001C94FE0F|nr:hypothetical protein [Fictibacillus nanhaiensis]MBY6037799.1 hypothetical protein [Fictibacillus nanhaiensis]